jgi:hypothetical protein
LLAYHGFDVADYPGDSTIARFIEPSPFSWVGFHLGGPSYQERFGLPAESGWSRKAYLHLLDLGLGIVPIYGGRARAARDSTDWRAWLGEDADQAAGAAEKLGLPAGTVIFLHIENGRRLFRAQRGYVAGWTERIDSLSCFRGGACCHGVPAETLRTEGYTAPIWLVKWAGARGGCPSQAGRRSSPANPCPPSLGLRPEPGPAIRQYAGEVYTSYGGVCLRLNLNLSPAADPARPAPDFPVEGPHRPAHN